MRLTSRSCRRPTETSANKDAQLPNTDENVQSTCRIDRMNLRPNSGHSSPHIGVVPSVLHASWPIWRSSTPSPNTINIKQDDCTPMIELYKLDWSHYVEKIILALEFKQIPWRGIDVNAFSKKEMRHLPARQFVPLIHDTGRSVALSDSSPILKYLDEVYPQEPRLFPKGAQEGEEIYSLLIAMDSYLGIPARRLAYANMLIEKPTLMADLFLPRLWGGVLNWPGVRRISSAVVGMILTTRFRLHRNHEDGVYRRLEAFLLKLVSKLEGRQYLVGNEITAADLTLAALLRPLRTSYFFKNHPSLAPLFHHQEKIFERFSRPPYLYELNRGSACMTKPPRTAQGSAVPVHDDFSFDLRDAENDQQPVYHWRFLLSPYHYFQLRSQVPF